MKSKCTWDISGGAWTAQCGQRSAVARYQYAPGLCPNCGREVEVAGVPDMAIGSSAPHETAADPLWFMDRTDADGRERFKKRMAIQTGAKEDSGA